MSARRNLGLVVGVVVACCVSSPAGAQAPSPGTLDSTFGGTGVVLTSLGPFEDRGRDVVVDDLGRIVVAGSSYTDADGHDFAVVRYLPNGQYDPDFGADGIVTTPIAPGFGHDRAEAMVIQPDGRIVVAGSSSAGAQSNFVVVRYNSDGTLDTSFGGTGKVVTNLGYDAAAFDLVLQGDGKILLAGRITKPATGNDLCVVRYYPNGARDLAFGVSGVFAPTVNGTQVALGIALDSGGRIVLAGDTQSVGPRAFYLARLDSTGALDWDFGSFGTVLTPFGAGGAGARGVAIQSDGRIVAVGDTKSAAGMSADTALARYGEGGSLDSTFDGDGKLIAQLSVGDDAGADVQVQPNNKIVIVGVADGAGALMRFNGDGTPETGIIVTPLADFGGFDSLALQADGKIVAAGWASVGYANTEMAIARYHGDLVDLIFADGFDSP